MNSNKITMPQYRNKILQILYEEDARSPSNIFDCDELVKQMGVTWEGFQPEIVYLKEKGYIIVKERQLGIRIFRTLYLTAEGVDLVEKRMQDEYVQSKEQENVGDVFINHTSEDKPITGELADVLRPNRLHLYDLLDNHFNTEELREVCFYLQVDYDDLGGEGKKAKARELISFLDRRGQIAELTDLIRRLRPDIDFG